MWRTVCLKLLLLRDQPGKSTPGAVLHLFILSTLFWVHFVKSNGHAMTEIALDTSIELITGNYAYLSDQMHPISVRPQISAIEKLQRMWWQPLV